MRKDRFFKDRLGLEHGGEGMSTHRSSKSEGTPCGLIISVVPRTSDVPLFVARTTVGAIGDSRRILR